MKKTCPVTGKSATCCWCYFVILFGVALVGLKLLWVAAELMQ